MHQIGAHLCPHVCPDFDTSMQPIWLDLFLHEYIPLYILSRLCLHVVHILTEIRTQCKQGLLHMWSGWSDPNVSKIRFRSAQISQLMRPGLCSVVRQNSYHVCIAPLHSFIFSHVGLFSLRQEIPEKNYSEGSSSTAGQQHKAIPVMDKWLTPLTKSDLNMAQISEDLQH